MIGCWLARHPVLRRTSQSTRALWAIRSLVGPIPAVLLTAGILLAAFYPLTRERHAHLREELAQRRAVD